MRAVRILVRCLVGVAALLVIAAGAAAWLLGTESGTAWLLARALPRAEPYLTVQGPTSGTLLETFVLREVTLSVPGHELRTARVSVSPDLGLLLGGTLHLDAVEIAAVDYAQTPVETPAEPSGAVELPVDVVVERVAIAGIEATVGETVQQVGPTEASVTYRGARLELDDFSTSAAGFDVAGRAAGTLAEPLELDVALDWSGEYGGNALAGALSASGTWPAIDVRHELTMPFRVVSEGRVEVGAEPSFDVETAWQDAVLEELDPLERSSGTLRVSGTLEQFSFGGDGSVAIEGPDGELREGEFSVTGERDGDVVRLMPLALSAALGRVEANGSFQIGTLTFEADVSGRSLDPVSELPDWPADLAADGRLTGRLQPGIELAFEDFTLDGELRGRPLSASGAVSYSAEALRIREVAVESGPSRASVDGTLGERVDARFTADVADLSNWLPELEGALEADLSVSGTPETPRVSGRVSASALVYEDLAVENLSFEGDVGAALDSPVDAVVEAQGVSRGPVEVDAIRAELAGDAREHRVTLEAQAPRWRASSRASGRLEGRSWQGTVAALEIVQDALGDWSLAEPVALALGPGDWQIGMACLRRQAASVCGSLTLTGSPEDALMITATDFDLRALEPLLPESFELQGVYQLDARLTSLTTSPTGEITVDGAATTVGFALSETETVETVVDSVTVDVGLSGWAMRVDAGFSGVQTGEATLALEVDDVRAESSPVAGQISVRWEDLTILSLLSPDVGQVGGRVGVDLALGGTLDAPTVEGRAELTSGFVSVPAWGTDFEDIQATATSRDGRTLDVEATGRAGEGTLTLEGTTQLDPAAGWPTRGVVRGENVRAVQLPEAEVYVSPNLNVLVAGSSVQVAGRVDVPRARIEIEQLPQQAVTPSADAVVHGAPQIEEAEPRPLEVTADMTIALGENVSYEGSGLMAGLSGDLRLQYESGQPETATGTLDIDGTYTAYGQTLELERGRLLFTGPLDNPTLDVRAVRRVEEVTVGVQLVGPLQTPQTMIFSTPTMSEADALSYLLFGRALEDAGQSADGEALEAAALSMGLQQALPVVERIGETLGLDELTVASTEVDSGALMAGKQLSPRLYMRYSYGLFNRIGGLLLRFKVNERLSIETRSGDQKSMDLLYTVEKD